MYSKVLKIRTNEPIDSPILFANTTDKTSIPSIAPPNLIVNPLPIPDITPPNIAHRSKSEPASGEMKDTSMGNTFIIKNDISE